MGAIPLCDTISKGYCAIWGVSRTGPLSICLLPAHAPTFIGVWNAKTHLSCDRPFRILARESVSDNLLGVPDVSRERRCLQISPEQLKATKDKKTKNWNFRPREAREFLGRWDKNSNTVKTQQFHTSGVCLREGKNSRTKIRQ